MRLTQQQVRGSVETENTLKKERKLRPRFYPRISKGDQDVN